MNDHDWLKENLATYLADGLDGDERQRVEKHVAACPECAQLFKDSKSLETRMKDLLAAARPDAALEERAVNRFRKNLVSRPTWLRFVAAAAAVVVLGAVGAVVQMAMDGGSLFGPEQRDRTVASNNLRSYFGGLLIHGHIDHEKNFDGEQAGGRKLSVLDDSDSMRDKVVDGRREGFSKQSRIDPSDLYNFAPTQQTGTPPALSLKESNELSPEYLDPANLTMRYGFNVQVPPTTNQSSLGDADEKKHKWSDLAAAKSEQTMKVMNGELGFFVRPGDSARPALTPPRLPVQLESVTDAGVLILGAEPMNNRTYFRTDGTVKAPPPAVYSPPPAPKPPEKAEKPKSSQGNQAPDGGKKPEAKVEDSPVLQPNKGEPPQAATDPTLKIIRTGDMEFEVASYDGAFKNVNKLIASVKGGFVLREESRKQENGKKRGTVVVRMPPQFLTKFMDDLREDLEKAGELKTQRVGSQDVTKDYTDTKSELTALRTFEGRLLEIMKNPKSEVKDLLNVEKELGIQRVKIEKLEGMIRFYDNSVGLSTLTINLTEKEIQTASGMVVSEKVQMRLEVEDVATAKDAVIKAAEELKGRVVKAEFKQEKGGQLEAIVHAEIPPAKRKSFTDALEKLGLVSDRESSQSQKAEGGTRTATDVKRRTEDVLFEITLNNIVGMNPRHAVVMVVATSDVPANYKKLDDAVRAAQGRVLESKLNDPDKQRITAILRFDVPADKKTTFEKLLGDFGPVLKRDAEELAANIKATEQRYGFAVFLRSIATLPPREKIEIDIVDVKDVQKKAAELAEIARANKGVADKPNVTLTQKGETSAVLTVRVPLSSNDVVLPKFMEAGKVVKMNQNPNPQVVDHELATAEIRLNLYGGSPIVPSDEGIWPMIRAGLYRSFQVFSFCIMLVVIGLGGVLPWILVIWAGYKVVIWWMAAKPTPAAAK